MTRNHFYAVGTCLFVLVGLAPEKDRLFTLLVGIAVVVACYLAARKLRRLKRMQRACHALRYTGRQYFWRLKEKKKHTLQTA